MVAARVLVRLFWVQVTARTLWVHGHHPGEVTSPDTTRELVALGESA